MCGPSLFRAGAARLYFHPWKRAGSEDNLAGFVEHILSSRKQAVGQRYPICTAMDEFGIRRLCVIIVAVDLNQTSIGLDAVHVVIQLAILADDAILQLGIRLRRRNRCISPSYRPRRSCRTWQAAGRWSC